MINAVVVGYGFAGRGFHCYLLKQAPGLHLYGVVSSRAEAREQAQREYGVKTFATLEQALDDSNVQLLVVATPHHTHASLCIQAMNAGRHVVTDKVMCMNTSEADAMIAAARQHNVMLSVFHNRRWDWDYLTVKKAIADGLLGEPFLFESVVLMFGPRRTRWREEAAHSGGLMFDWGAHFVDQALDLIPSTVESVYCDIQYHRVSDADAGDHARLTLRFANKAVFHTEMSKAGRLAKPRWWILGTAGALIQHGVDPQEPAMLAGNIDAATQPPEHRALVKTERDGQPVELTLETVRGSWKSYYQNIADHLNEGRELIVQPEQIRRVMQVFDAARVAAGSGMSVSVNI